MRHISLLAVSLLALAACTPEKQQEADDYTPVSYTHLTLPTKLEV